MAAGQRILVSISLSATPRSVESALAHLWEREPAELAGLLIEDPDVLTVSRLRVSREVRYDEPQTTGLNVADMERQIRAHGRRVRTAFESRARAMNLVASFRVARGPLATALQEACAGFDMLVVAAARDWMGQRLSLRTQLPILLTSGPRTLVIVQEAPQSTGGVAVVYADSDSGRAALQTAVRIARSEGLALSVLMRFTDEGQQARLGEQAQAIVADYPATSYHRLAGQQDAVAIAAAATRAAARLLVLPRSDAEADRQLALEVVERTHCSVILTG